MSKSVPLQRPAVVLRPRYRRLRSLLAVMIVAVVSLTTTVVVLVGDDTESTTTSSVTRSYPTLADPFQSAADQPSSHSRPDESAIAAAIASHRPISRSYPTLDDPFQTQAEGPRPQTAVSAPDESKIAATLARHADSDPQARAAQEEQTKAFVKGH